MNRKIIIALTSITLMLSGCGNHSSKKGSGKASASPKASESSEPEKTGTPEGTTQSSKENEGTAQEDNSQTQSGSSNTNQNPDISGNYQIISYDNGSGDKETFNPGKDDSIIGSSSIILKKDGTCEYNMPGVGENTSCTWSGTSLQAAGAETQFSISGDEMTFQQNGETYTFKKAK